MPFFSNKKDARKVLFIAPESAPFAKAGGLGEVIFALPRSLRRPGFDVRVMIPRYAGIDPEKFHLSMEYEGLEVPTDSSGEKENEPQYLLCNVRKYTPPAKSDPKEKLPVTTYFLENQEYYEKRSNVYGYTDDVIRWALLCRGTLEFLRMSRDWKPDLIIASDWQTSFLSNYLRTVYKDDTKLSSIATIFMIHNLYYQGTFGHRYISEMDYDDGQSALPSFYDPRFLKLNGMRRGIMYSDLITTVSPTYAKEIMTKDYGELLEDLIKERRVRLHGVLNGVDYSELNPKTDPNLVENFDSENLEARTKNKTELQARFGLPQNDNIPVIGIVSRLSEQKGFDLLFPIMADLLKELNFQLVVVGAGEAKYMGFFKELMEKFPTQVSAHLSFDNILPRLVFGGADMVLLPSKFEPSGLVQMEAMRYGAIPIARKTGGLADSVIDIGADPENGTGFIFSDFNSLALAIAITRACENYKNGLTWKKLQQQAMSADFSWDKSAEEYSRLIDMAVETRAQEVANKK